MGSRQGVAEDLPTGMLRIVCSILWGFVLLMKWRWCSCTKLSNGKTKGSENTPRSCWERFWRLCPRRKAGTRRETRERAGGMMNGRAIVLMRCREKCDVAGSVSGLFFCISIFTRALLSCGVG